MWNSNRSPIVTPKSIPEHQGFGSATPANEYGGRNTEEYGNRMKATPAATNLVTIGKGMIFKGTVIGGGSLVVEGELQGNINLPESRVIVAPTGKVSDGLSVCINAREIIVMGKIRGNVAASDRVEICAEGTLLGDVSAARISIADGAYFKGDINLHSISPKKEEVSERVEEQAQPERMFA